jgi:hypothetical protein
MTGFLPEGSLRLVFVLQLGHTRLACQKSKDGVSGILANHKVRQNTTSRSPQKKPQGLLFESKYSPSTLDLSSLTLDVLICQQLQEKLSYILLKGEKSRSQSFGTPIVFHNELQADMS